MADDEIELKRKPIIREIFTTEKTYVEYLEALVKLFVQPLRELARSANPVLTPEEIKQVFSEVETIYHFNSTFLNDLQTNQDKNMGELFLQMAGGLKMYAPYINNFDHALNYVANKEHKEFRAFADNVIKSNAQMLRGNELPALLIMPVQRIPRYVLLLRDLVKRTPESHPEFSKLTEALRTVTDLAGFVDKRKTDSDNLKRLAAVEQHVRKTPSWLQLLQPHRRLLREGKLTCLSSSSDGIKPGPLYVFLFNDSLMLTVGEKNGGYLFSDFWLMSHLTINMSGKDAHNVSVRKLQMSQSTGAGGISSSGSLAQAATLAHSGGSSGGEAGLTAATVTTPRGTGDGAGALSGGGSSPALLSSSPTGGGGGGGGINGGPGVGIFRGASATQLVQGSNFSITYQAPAEAGDVSRMVNVEVALQAPTVAEAVEWMEELMVAQRETINDWRASVEHLPDDIDAEGPFPLHRAGAVVLDSMMYVFGGRDDSDMLTNDMWVLHAGDGQLEWTQLEQKGDVPSAREGHAMVRLSEHKIGLFGGFDGWQYLNDSYVFSAAQGTWKKLPSFPGPGRLGHTATMVVGADGAGATVRNLFVIGGANADQVFADEVITASFTKGSSGKSHMEWRAFKPSGPAPPGLQDHTTHVSGPNLLVIGGLCNRPNVPVSILSPNSRKAMVLNLERLEWSAVSLVGSYSPVRRHASFEYENMIFIFGGMATGTLSPLMVVNPATMRCFEVPMPEGTRFRANHIGGLMDTSRIVFFGGVVREEVLSDLMLLNIEVEGTRRLQQPKDAASGSSTPVGSPAQLRSGLSRSRLSSGSISRGSGKGSATSASTRLRMSGAASPVGSPGGAANNASASPTRNKPGLRTRSSTALPPMSARSGSNQINDPDIQAELAAVINSRAAASGGGATVGATAGASGASSPIASKSSSPQVRSSSARTLGSGRGGDDIGTEDDQITRSSPSLNKSMSSRGPRSSLARGGSSENSMSPGSMKHRRARKDRLQILESQTLFRIRSLGRSRFFGADPKARFFDFRQALAKFLDLPHPERLRIEYSHEIHGAVSLASEADWRLLHKIEPPQPIALVVENTLPPDAPVSKTGSDVTKLWFKVVLANGTTQMLHMPCHRLAAMIDALMSSFPVKLKKKEEPPQAIAMRDWDGTSVLIENERQLERFIILHRALLYNFEIDIELVDPLEPLVIFWPGGGK